MDKFKIAPSAAIDESEAWSLRRSLLAPIRALQFTLNCAA